MQRHFSESARFALIVLVLMLSAVPASAQDAVIREVTLEEAQRLFRQNNLELTIARSRVDEAVALIRNAAAYPNPSASVSHEALTKDGAGYSESYFNVNQRFLWPGVRSSRVEMASRLADAIASDLTADSLRLSFDVSRMFTEVTATAERVHVLREVAEIYREADRVGTSRLEEGETSGYDFRRVRVERARYENQLSAALLEQKDAHRRLEMLILSEDDASVELKPVPESWEVPGDLRFELVLELALSNRAELESANASMEAAVASEQLSQRERRPDLLASAGYKRQLDGFDGLVLSIGAPIPVFDRNRGTMEAARARVHAAQTRQILLERRIAADVRRAWETYTSLFDRHQLMVSDLLGDIEALLSSAQVAYSEGEMTLIELLDAVEAYRDARISTLDLDTSLRVAYHDLVRAAGGMITTP